MDQHPHTLDSNSHNLDFLRACAVLFVAFAHLLQTWRIESIIGWVTISDMAQMGVLIFFVHTSLVLMLSLGRQMRSDWRWYADFYIRRACRIYPLAIVVVLLMIIARIPPFPNQPFVEASWKTVGANLGLVQNLSGDPSVYAPLWSLPYEVQMYLVLPFLFLALRYLPGRLVAPLLWAGSAVAVMALGAAGFEQIALFYYVPCFVAGIVAYSRWPRGSRRLPFWLWPLLIAGCVCLRSAAGNLPLRHIVLPAGWVGCFALGWSAPSIAELQSVWLRKTAAVLAKYSYGIYLSNAIVLWVAFDLLKAIPLPLQFLVWAALSVAAPVFAYHVIEEPMIRAGRRLARSAAGASRQSHETVPAFAAVAE